MTPPNLRELIAEAALAPSVHNVQPARWRIEADGATLFEDLSRRLVIGDPKGHDAAISLGAAAEGFRLAAGRAGWRAVSTGAEGQATNDLSPVARLRLEPGGQVDPLADAVARRRSWRGAFATATRDDRAAAEALASEDAAVIVDPGRLREAGTRLDEASWRFMRHGPFRRELLSWMRLSTRRTGWDRDGLNARAMAMSPLAARAAGLVLGPLFAPLAAIGAARPLIAEGGRIARDAGVILFHRPATEPPFESGAAFYRLWLRIEAAGFGAQVLAALADDEAANAWTREAGGVPADRRLVSAFRIGRVPEGEAVERARLPLDEILID